MVNKRFITKTMTIVAFIVAMVQADMLMDANQFKYFGTLAGNTSWQEISSVSCSWDDVNGNSIFEVGEEATFTVTMDKTFYGTHDFDALQVWLDEAPWISAPYLATDYFEWDYNAGIADYQDRSKYSYKAWDGGVMSFELAYTFTEAGYYDFAASVMCSDDLSDLVGYTKLDNPSEWDKQAWENNPLIHDGRITNRNGGALQGETQFYRLKVESQSVPEPTILSLLGCGLLGLVFIRRKK